MTKLLYTLVAFCVKRTLSSLLSLNNLSTISMSSAKESYEFTIATLNSLQSNAQTVAKCRAQGQQGLIQTLRSSVSYFRRSGLELEDLIPLNIIHVAGTKGKGSVCALTESILRSHGYKTGLFSSPHLVHVTERIKIDGHMISKDDFCRHFWNTYERLDATKTIEDSSMPAYFKFLLIMAFHVFLTEKVDVAIIEVGIGGAYDCTNIITHPVVCAITTLDYDHIELLGDTLEKIAWQKAGIFKKNSIALCAHQEPNALTVIKERSKELRCPCFVVPSFSSYKKEVEIGIPGLPQKENASLAVQICRVWMKRIELSRQDSKIKNGVKNGFIQCKENGSIPIMQPFNLTGKYVQGLRDCKWPGRCQTLVKDGVTYFLDGAHTPKSLKYCVQWFRDNSSPNSVKVLIFNCTSGRDSKVLLQDLNGCAFDAAIFCPNVVSSVMSLSSDIASVNVTSENALKVCTANEKTWLDLSNNNVHNSSYERLETVKHCRTVVQPCISSALAWVSDKFCSIKSVEVLITGSLHLVGGALSILDPNM